MGLLRSTWVYLGLLESGLVSIEGFKDVWNNQTYMSMDGWMGWDGLDGISPDRSISRSPSGDKKNLLKTRNGLWIDYTSNLLLQSDKLSQIPTKRCDN